MMELGFNSTSEAVEALFDEYDGHLKIESWIQSRLQIFFHFSSSLEK